MSEWRTAGKVRMTPKGTYDSTAAYEILDIITNSSGTASYIAKKAVPAGTALTNTEYWEPIVNIDEVLDDIESQIESLNRIATGAYSGKSTSGSIAKFDDGADGVPVKALSVAIESQIGVTGATIMRFGKNLWPDTYNPTPIDGLKRRSVFVGDNTVTLSTTMPRNTNGACNLFLLAGQVTTGENSNTNGVDVNTNRTVAAVDGYVTVSYRLVDGVDPRNYDVQLEFGGTATSFEPYQTPSEYSVTFPSEAGTIYGGTLDVVNGVLTTGGQDYDVTPFEVTTLRGANTIYADCGDVTVTYRTDLELFLDSNYVKKNDYNNTIEDLNDKDDQVGAKLLALLKKNMTDTTENGYLINSMCSYMGFKDILYFYNHKTVDINTGEIKQASEGIPGSVPPMYQISGATDYIDVGTQLIFKISKDLPYNCYCYDSSKQYLGRATVNNTQSAYEIECLTNTKYIRLSFYLPSLDQDRLLRSVQGTLVVINNQKYCYVETAYDE